MLKASTGIGGRSTKVTGRAIADVSARTGLANARLPKYTAATLLPIVIPYILRRDRISRSRAWTDTAYLNVTKTSEENKKNKFMEIWA